MKYIGITRRIFGMLGLRMREGALLIMLLGVFAALEGFGISLLLPILQYLETGGEALPTGSVWPYLTSASEALGVPINLGTLLLLAFLPILLRQAVFYLKTWYTAVLQNRAISWLTVRSFRAVARAEMAFIDTQDQGKLIAFISGQVGRCGAVLTEYVKLLGSVAIVAVYAVLLIVLSWQLAVIAILAMGGVSIVVRRILVGTRVHGKEVTRAAVLMTGAVRERLEALRLVKMRAREDEEAAHVGSLADAVRYANIKIATAAARVEVIVDPALMLAVFVVIYIGVTAYGMTLANLGLFMFVVLRLNGNAKQVNLGRQRLAGLMPSFDYVEETLAASESAPTPEGGTRQFSSLERGIEFDDVGFTYKNGESEVLKAISLVIPKGSMTAIVGRSGAGKSTLVDMIPLLRRPTSGRILFDGIPTDEFALASLRRGIGFLTQEPMLFNDTIKANLLYGIEHDVSQEDIQSALEDSYCAEFVDELSDGIHTNVGDRGTRFSGGQLQRLALARVLLQDPQVLILDEPTSALDSESEAYIQRAFERISKERTVIVIAHRFSTVESADQIVVLHEGGIAEVGAHRELLERQDGQYRRLFDMQIRTAAADADSGNQAQTS